MQTGRIVLAASLLLAAVVVLVCLFQVTGDIAALLSFESFCLLIVAAAFALRAHHGCSWLLNGFALFLLGLCLTLSGPGAIIGIIIFTANATAVAYISFRLRYSHSSLSLFVLCVALFGTALIYAAFSRK